MICIVKVSCWQRGLPPCSQNFAIAQLHIEQYHFGSTMAPVAKRKQSDDGDGDGKPLAPKQARKSNEENIGASGEIGHGIDFFSIDLVATTIFSYLDARQLYRVSTTNKFLQSLIQHKHVIRSALYQGGKARQNINRLKSLIEERKIWIPSPCRILRLCNGKRCEKCNDCKVTSVSKQFGLFICDHCLENSLTSLTRSSLTVLTSGERYVSESESNDGSESESNDSSESESNEDAFESDDDDPFPFRPLPKRLAVNFGRSKVLKTTHTDNTGEKAGALITMAQIDMIVQKCGEMDFDGILEQCDAEEQNSRKTVAEILGAYNDSIEGAHSRTKYRVKRAKEKFIERRNSFRTALMKEIGRKPWKKNASSSDRAYVKWERHPSIRFKSELSQSLLSGYDKAPSKATEKKTKELAQTMVEAFDLIWARNLQDFSFLSESNLYEATLKEFFVEEYPNFEHLYMPKSEDIDALRSGAAPMELPSWKHLPVDEPVISKIVSTVQVQQGHEHKQYKVQRLATKIYKSTFGGGSCDPCKDFLYCLDRFPSLACQRWSFCTARKEPGQEH